MSAILCRDGRFRMRLTIVRCPNHKEFWAISIDGNGGGTRLTASKCCGRWDEVKSWLVSIDELGRIIADLQEAQQAIETALDSQESAS